MLIKKDRESQAFHFTFDHVPSGAIENDHEKGSSEAIKKLSSENLYESITYGLKLCWVSEVKNQRKSVPLWVIKGGN